MHSFGGMKRLAFAAAVCLCAAAYADGPAAATLEIQQQNRMGARFKLVRAEYTLDGTPIFAVDDEKKLGSADNVAIATRELPPGKHQLAVSLVYRGAGLAYARGYRFTAKNHVDLEVAPQQKIAVQIVAKEKGGITTPVEQRPMVEIQTSVPPAR
jgi:hypothetical protein